MSKRQANFEEYEKTLRVLYPTMFKEDSISSKGANQQYAWGVMPKLAKNIGNSLLDPPELNVHEGINHIYLLRKELEEKALEHELTPQEQKSLKSLIKKDEENKKKYKGIYQDSIQHDFIEYEE